MTPAELRQARLRLGLSTTQMGRLLGYDGVNIRAQVHKMEAGEKPIRAPQQRLVRAYLDGYRPEDWPLDTRATNQ